MPMFNMCGDSSSDAFGGKLPTGLLLVHTLLTMHNLIVVNYASTHH